METSPLNILIDHDLRPAYYDDFQCIEAGCRISCCKNWDITFNKKDYLSLKKLRRSPVLSDRIDHAMHRIRENDAGDAYAKFDLKNGTCPLLDESGLCALQLEKGLKALPEICRLFPRKKRYSITGYLEYDLSPACEAVLELLWNLPDGIIFKVAPVTKDDVKIFSVEKSSPMVSYAFDIRNLCIDILQDRRLPLPQRIILMGARLQELIRNESDIPAWISKTNALLSDSNALIKYRALAANGEQARSMYINNNLHTLSSIINGTSAFKEDFNAIADLLISQGNDTPFDISVYSEAETDFSKKFGNKEYFFENLAVNLLFFLGMPIMKSPDKLWESYVNFCNIYSFFRFVSVLSTKVQLIPPAGNSEGEASIPGSRDALFQILAIAGRSLIHNEERSGDLRDEFFRNDSATLAHMAILVSG